MKAKSPEIIKTLNEVLTLELTAINQYFLHAEMCGDWGFTKLYKAIRAESIDEMKHAERLIERILFLDGLPNVQRMHQITVGESVAEQLALDLTLENKAIPILNAGIKQCRDEGDNGTRALFESILVDEERHVDWLEAQLELIKQIGVENYLAQQVEQEG